MAIMQKILKLINKTDYCWLWLGRKTQWGYGICSIRKNGKSTSTSAHRAVYEMLVDKIPKDYQLDHLCSNRICVNPEHMEIVTPRENTMRADTAPATINSKKTHCLKGHEFSESNTYKRKDRKTRECRICRTEAVRNFIKKRGLAWQQ